MLDGTAFKQLFSGHASLRLLSGSPPASADAAETGTLLAVISLNGATISGSTNCLTFAAASGGSIAMSGTWKVLGANVTSGTPGYFRLVIADSGATPHDDATLSTTQYRVQGTVGAGGAELNIGSGALTNGTDQPISYFTITFPPGS
jgi:hypothetical protein